MTTNFHLSMKRSPASLRGFKILSLFLIFTFVSLSSCSYPGYKKELTAKADEIMTAVTNGQFSSLPGLEEALKEMDADSAAVFKESLQKISKWKISVGKIQNMKVIVSVETTSDDNSRTIYMSFLHTDEKWVLEDKIQFSRHYDFIPLVNP